MRTYYSSICTILLIVIKSRCYEELSVAVVLSPNILREYSTLNKSVASSLRLLLNTKFEKIDFYTYFDAKDLNEVPSSFLLKNLLREGIRLMIPDRFPLSCFCTFAITQHISNYSHFLSLSSLSDNLEISISSLISYPVSDNEIIWTSNIDNIHSSSNLFMLIPTAASLYNQFTSNISQYYEKSNDNDCSYEGTIHHIITTYQFTLINIPMQSNDPSLSNKYNHDSNDDKNCNNNDNDNNTITMHNQSTSIPLFEWPVLYIGSRIHMCTLWWPVDKSEVFIVSPSTTKAPRTNSNPENMKSKLINFEVFYHCLGIPSHHILVDITFNGLTYVANASSVLPYILNVGLPKYVLKPSKNILQVSFSIIRDENPLIVEYVGTVQIELQFIFGFPVTPAFEFPYVLMQRESRDQFGPFLNMLQLTGTMVEVGVGSGAFTSSILSTWKGRQYILVDPWVRDDGEEYGYPLYVGKSQEEHDDAFASVQKLVEPHSSKFLIYKMPNTDASLLIADQSIDFIYIDAKSDYVNVMSDMRCWWPKLRDQGILAVQDERTMHVTPRKFAVMEFGRKMNLSIYMAGESEYAPIWFLVNNRK